MNITRPRRQPGPTFHIRLALPGLVASAAAVLTLAPAATASELLARNASGVQLAVSNDGKALITFRSQGKLNRVLAWGR